MVVQMTMHDTVEQVERCGKGGECVVHRYCCCSCREAMALVKVVVVVAERTKYTII